MYCRRALPAVSLWQGACQVADTAPPWRFPPYQAMSPYAPSACPICRTQYTNLPAVRGAVRGIVIVL